MKEQLRKIVREIMREISISELDEAQSPAQKAAFEKMLAKKDGKDESTDKKEEVKESNINEDKVSNGTVSTLEKGIQRILGTEVNHDINRNGAHEFYIDDAEFVIGVNDGKEKKVAYSFSIYDDGARKYLGKGTSADEKDLIKQVLSIAKKYKKQLLLTTESVVEESINEVDTKKAEQIRKAASGYVGPKFAKKASDEDILAMADLKDEKASLYNRHLKDIMGKISKLQKKYNIKESVINEGFGVWEMTFADMNLNGVKLSKKNKYKVKARNTVEAIKKAAKMAGVKDGDWIATNTHSLNKIG